MYKKINTGSQERNRRTWTCINNTTTVEGNFCRVSEEKESDKAGRLQDVDNVSEWWKPVEALYNSSVEAVGGVTGRD